MEEEQLRRVRKQQQHYATCATRDTLLGQRLAALQDVLSGQFHWIVELESHYDPQKDAVAVSCEVFA